MKYASIRKMDISNGEGIGVSIFVQGCPLHCKGCFQPETWNPHEGKDLTLACLKKIAHLCDKEYITRFSVLGGEPLANYNVAEVRDMIVYIRSLFPEIKIWVWSGYTYKEILDKAANNNYYSNILGNIDVLVAGPFIQEEKDLTLKWCGSRNQQVIDMNKTREQGHVVLYE